MDGVPVGIVDVKDVATRRLYEGESFLPFPEQPLKLFRQMTDIAKLPGLRSGGQRNTGE